MNNTNQAQADWRKQSKASKTYLIIIIVCIAMLSLCLYIMKMSGDPAERGNTAVTIAYFFTIFVGCGSFVLHGYQTFCSKAIHQACLEMIRAETARKEAEEKFLLGEVQKYLEEKSTQSGVSEGQTPTQLSEEQLQQLITEVKAELSQSESSEQSDSTYYSKALGKTNIGAQIRGVYVNFKNKSKPGDSTKDTYETLQVKRLDTDELQTEATKEALQQERLEQLKTPDLSVENTSPPDSPENATPVQSTEPETTVTATPTTESKFVSIEEQAKELGIDSALLKFYLGGLDHYSQLTHGQCEKLRKHMRVSGCSLQAFELLDQAQQLGNQVYEESMVS